MIKNIFQNIIQMTKVSFKEKKYRLISSKSTSYPSYTVHSKQYNEEKEIIHSGGFKRNHTDRETRSVYDCENENWFSKQLSSEENYDELNNIVNEGGRGSKLFPYKYGNSFYEYTNKDLNKKIKEAVNKINNISITNSTEYHNENQCIDYDDEYNLSK